MLDDDDKITAYAIDEKMINDEGESKRLSYMRKENTRGKVPEITVTVSGVL